MDPPHFLLNALNDSIASGTFVDTKFNVFSRREVSGRVGSPRALYCNSRILDTVPYFYALFSDGFSEGQTRDIGGVFPTDSHLYTEDYDYLSDSDLEDESSRSEGDEEPPETERNSQQSLEDSPDQRASETVLPDPPPPYPLSVEAREGRTDDRPDGCDARMGKVAIIHDMGAVTLEAVLYFLYTNEIKFAPFSSDPRHELPARARTGDWSTGKPPSPSAKSIYRLADKYDIPRLKDRARVCIFDNLGRCNIVEEVFSSFSLSFPEVLSMQVSQLVRQIKEESNSPWGTGNTRKQLQEKIAGLSQPQLVRAMDTLAMIWSGMKESSEAPMTRPTLISPVSPTTFPNWHRVERALLRSILTGTFIDAQFYAYNAISNDILVDPRPLFTSSLVIEEWGPAITTQTLEMDSRFAFPADGPIDDYDIRHGELLEELPKEKILRNRTEAATDESREAVILMSGAWKTWESLFSYAYTNKMPFAPLRTPAEDGDPVVDAGVQLPHLCSPRSMYSLAAVLEIKAVEKIALERIRSDLSTSNIATELFSSFTASHKAVLDAELQFLHETFTEKDPKLLMDHIRKMASGEAPFFPTTLSLVYDGFIEKVGAPPKRNITGPIGFGGQQGGTPVLPKASTSTSGFTVSPSPSVTPSSNLQAVPALTLVSPSSTNEGTGLRCVRCCRVTTVHGLRDGLYCPVCPRKKRNARDKGRTFMRCAGCDTPRDKAVMRCDNSNCRATFT